MSGFVTRHIGPSPAERDAMLATVGYATLDDLVDAAIPQGLDTGFNDALPEALDEPHVLRTLREIASRNRVHRPMIGLGYYGTVTPQVIARNVFENPAWYTAYTPYQPEISQGRLEALLNFQTMICDLTGLEVANASMLDESTAAAEAMLLARRASKSASSVFLVDADVLPQTLDVLSVRAEPVGIELRVTDFSVELPEAFGVLIQYPGASGRLWDPRDVIDAAHAAKALAIVSADPLACTLVTPPGELGADIAIGTTQRFGIPLGFGGPHAGYMAVSKGLERKMPGRLVGVSKDADGNVSYRLALQTREQHIRREKATSNICTAQVLLAVMASMFAVYHGPEGLKAIASRVATTASRLAECLAAGGVEVGHDNFFDTVQARLPGRADEVVRAAYERGVLLRRISADEVGISVDETTGEDDLRAVLAAFRVTEEPPTGDGTAIPAELVRSSEFLTHEVFHRYRSETAMMRYLARLAGKDFALDRGMIPLGSCTLKLNSAVEMAPVSWPQFAAIHPFAPREDVEGYLELVEQLEGWLATLTGYDAVSLQPNAGSQGELTGLLAIRRYHQSRGDDDRRVCLIPSSAHGTNAASAVLAGLKVVVVACDEDGNVDLDDLREKIAASPSQIAALMVTYPSTHGVFEQNIREVTGLVHEAGGQVYIDGANFNALVGVAKLTDLGGDVSHLNLHKTFAIPHGGGGPGVGPVAARSHLAPFLPGHPMSQRTGDRGGGPVSEAPFGSASILPISWSYLRLMGAAGLRAATEHAVLAANYVATRLGETYPILYTGQNSLVAHECIVDLRPLRAQTGITVDDVAKRLIDYGFHAPTMSFPVSGTLMVEPTESEDKDELDRFCEAMLAIHAEAMKVADGTWPADDNPLVHAPFTAESVTANEWDHPFDRQTAAYPGERAAKYWPPVRRIDQAYGDRHFVCTCPPPEAFED